MRRLRQRNKDVLVYNASAQLFCHKVQRELVGYEISLVRVGVRRLKTDVQRFFDGLFFLDVEFNVSLPCTHFNRRSVTESRLTSAPDNQVVANRPRTVLQRAHLAVSRNLDLQQQTK